MPRAGPSAFTFSPPLERLRNETGYRWRFRFERAGVDAARAAALEGLGTAADRILSSDGLEWRAAAAYAGRARGERKRPRHGWASLTPTERDVVALVAQGYTNPEVAERLLMGRATVKSHLEHVFAKVGVRSRVELAAQAVQHTDD